MWFPCVPLKINLINEVPIRIFLLAIFFLTVICRENLEE
jgi:hypothetical protein